MSQAIADGSDICISDTNLNTKYRVPLVERLLRARYNVTYVLFDVPVHVCEARNALRGPMAVDKSAYKRLTPLFMSARRNLKQECSRLGATLFRIKAGEEAKAEFEKIPDNRSQSNDAQDDF
jgi:predicted kinase